LNYDISIARPESTIVNNQFHNQIPASIPIGGADINIERRQLERNLGQLLSIRSTENI